MKGTFAFIVSKLLFTLRSSKVLRFLIVTGKFPDNLLSERLIKIVLRLPMVAGIAPLNWLKLKSIALAF